MNLILQINGGMGKCIAATAVCKAIKHQYPDDNLIVVSAYPDVFLNNPYIYRSYGFNNVSYFYNEYIENKDFKIFAHDPYFDTEYIKQDTSLIRLWCEMFDIPYNGEKPEIFLNQREIKFYQNRYTSDKPIMVIQPNGGAQLEYKYSWARDIPKDTVDEVIKEFKNSYNIFHIKREDQINYEHTIPILDPFRAVCVLLMMSKKRLLIDSFVQHAASALNLPSTVCWIGTSPKVFGYDIHDNIISNEFTSKPELKNSYFSKFNIIGDFLEFPYQNESDIFNSNKIIESIKKQ